MNARPIFISVALAPFACPVIAQEELPIKPLDISVVGTMGRLERPVGQPRPLIQLAILLDTSGSMEGLIDQARAQIWSVVNEFALAEQNGVKPELQVALFHYGNDTLPPQEGYVQMLLPLTTDLDAISEKLFALTTNGGSEYCGWVIGSAVESLAWSESNDDLRVIVIAGNEGFDQGSDQKPYQKTIEAAVRKGIIVNTIFCGNDEEGRRTGWYDGAILGEGRYGSIDQNAVAVHIPAPQDEALLELNTRLNATYLAFGRAGEALRERQEAQDANATRAGRPAAAARVQAKASALYTNTLWDLVDAYQGKSVKLEELKDEELPEELRGKSIDEKKAYIEKKAAERAEVQKQIQELAKARETFIALKRRELAEQGTLLESALLTALKEQARTKHFRFANEATPARDGGGR